ncbi:MAG TPA: PAS domain S-box protein [Cyanophyceae cyanobacterium]
MATIPGAVYHCAYKSAQSLQDVQPTRCKLPLRRMTFLSQAIQSISGYCASDFMNNRVRSFESIIHPQDKARIDQLIQQSIDTQQTYSIEYRIICADGSIRWVCDQGQSALEDTEEELPVDDNSFWLDGIIFDITEKKQVEAQLHRTQAFLDSLIENLPVGISIKDANELRVMYWNKASEDLFGYSKAEVLDKIDYDFLPNEQARYLRAQDRQVLASGELVEVSDAPLMTPHRGQRFVHTKKVPLLDDTGTPQYLLSIYEDITERKQAEEALRQSEAHHRRILETACEGIWMFDAQSQTTFANDRIAEMLGYTVEEMLGRSLFDFLDDDSCAIATTYIERRRQGIHERHDFKFRRKDGSDLWAIVSAQPILDSQGQFVGVLRMITDISDRKRAEQTLQQSAQQLKTKNQQLKQTLRQLKQTQAQLIQNEKMVSLGQLVAGIAHEINNPVSFIYGNIHHAREYASNLLRLVEVYNRHYPRPLPEIQREIDAIEFEFLSTDFPKLLRSIEEGANRIREIVLSLRNFSRLDEAHMKFVNIHEGIDSTLLILQHRLKKAPSHPEIKVIKEYGQLPPVECYPGPLNQVFMNLLSNAIDALETHPAPRLITIRSELVSRQQSEDGQQTPEFVVIRIADNGPGIPDDTKNRIFDHFFTTKPVGVGTGLGLSISHSIVVEKHRGTLTCRSSPGQGAEFVIELPLKQKRHGTS